jgi:hypothetical protein
MSRIKRGAMALLLAGGLSIGLSGPAVAQPVITGGLVNVTIVDVLDVEGNQVVVQVPIGIAANVCPTVNAAVLAQEFAQTGEAACDATAESTADSRAFLNFLEASGQSF